MAMIPEDEIERIKRETDLAAVVRSRGVELKPQGGDLVGRCPFHDDQSPSLRVTPAKGLWRCMSSACAATGNVIQFVQRFDGVSFRHAYELLKGGGAAAFTGAPVCQPVKKGTVPRLASPLSADADDQAALRQVIDYYHARLKENPAALAYLAKRGLRSEEMITTFKIGFVDRTLGLRLPHNNRKEGAALRKRLTRLGLLRETGHEHLRGRIVFPVIAENGEIGTVYGRAIDDGGKHERHLFLPGPQRGIWNPLSLRPQTLSPSMGSPNGEVILCEGIIDALTFWCAGFRYVTTGYSAKALSEELLKALVAVPQGGMRRVLIAFDRDEAGDKGAAEVAAQLAAYGVECLRVQFPHGQDANSYALAVTPPDKSLGVLLRAALPMDERGLPRRPVSPERGGGGSLGELRSKPSKPGMTSEVSAKEEVSLSADAAPSPSTAFAPGPSSLAAKAASEAAEDGPAPKKKSPPNEAAKEENHAAALLPTAAPVVPVGGVVVAKNEREEILLVIDGREWRVRGLSKNTGFESLKVSLRVSVQRESLVAPKPFGEGGWHLDQVDLCVARQRENFVAAAAVETNLRPELLKRDLGKILGKLEELQEARLRAETAPKKPEAEIPSALLEQARAFLRDPSLWDLIAEHAAACGIAGERVNMLVGYLGAVSRLLNRPLAIIIQSSSAAGKTTLMDAILAFVPPERRIKYSAMTGQSLFYMGGADLRHKILAIVEEAGAEKASYALKLLQSEGELTIASTGKDPHTGRMESQEYRVEGPTMIILTTTSHTLDEELQNRSLVLTVDESREQTERIHALQREARTETGIARKAQRAELLALHRAAQTLLQPLPVFNPYAEKLLFLSHQLRTRRDHEKYQLLIDSLALLFQHQRARKTIAGREHIVATLDDIARANELAHDVLGRGLDDMPPQTRRLLELIERMVAEKCAAAKTERTDARFRARHLREFTSWGHSQLHVHLSRLVELEYVIPHRADHGQGVVYELLYDGAGKNGARFLPGLIDVEKLRAACDYDEKHPGQNGGYPAHVRPVSGPLPGAVRPGENAQSSSENATPDALNDENAQPGPEKNDAAA